jgi:UDP-N-acetylmuramate: L-alanyl-gamma-D-glutamyl-meso-diaminopimelate ligase
VDFKSFERIWGALAFADEAVVLLTRCSQQLEEVTYDQIATAFNRKDLIIYTNPAEFKAYLFNKNLDNFSFVVNEFRKLWGLISMKLKK